MGDEVETKYCSNCKRDIAVTNFVMHEAHCARNIVLCKKCGEPVAKSEVEEHEDEYHRLETCDLCNKQFEVAELDQHKETCEKRMVQCTYCEMDCANDNLKNHMDFCGARTEQCSKCEQFIMIKDRVKHEDCNCTYPPRPEVDQPIDVGRDLRLPEASDLHRDFTQAAQLSFRSAELQRIMNGPAGSGLNLPGAGATGLNWYAGGAGLNRFGGGTGLSRPGAGVPGLRRPTGLRRTVDSDLPNDHPPPAPRGRGALLYGKPGATKPGAVKSENSRNVKPREPLHGAYRNRLVKDTNVARVQSDSKSNLKRAQQSNASYYPSVYGVNEFSPIGDDEVDADRLLAMQLANENEDLLTGDRRPPWIESGDLLKFEDSVESSGEAVPCEFCGNLFPLEELIQHSSGCHAAPADIFTKPDHRYRERGTRSRVSPIPVEEVTSWSTEERRGMRGGERGERRGVDTDMFSATQYSVEQETYSYDHLGTSDDGVMLPCEFCHETFTATLLFAHQPVCDLNRTKTPLPPKDAAIRPKDTNTRAWGATPESTRQSTSATRTRRTLDNLIKNPTDRPLSLRQEGSQDSSGKSDSSGNGERYSGTEQARGSKATGYQPSFAGTEVKTSGSRTKPRMVPGRNDDTDDLENVTDHRQWVQKTKEGRRP